MAISCTGVSSCWLVILIGAGSSEVGARSAGSEVGIAFVCMSRSLRAHEVARETVGGHRCLG